MRKFITSFSAVLVVGFILVWVPTLARAQQPTPPAGSAATEPAGSAAGTTAPTGADVPAPADADAPAPPAPASDPAGDVAGLRKTCTDAMNADPTFAARIIEIADKDAAERRLALDQAQHQVAATAVAKNQRHVILAYAAMWIIAAGFVLFLWRRQQALRTEIAHLRRDLDEASRDGK